MNSTLARNQAQAGGGGDGGKGGAIVFSGGGTAPDLGGTGGSGGSSQGGAIVQFSGATTLVHDTMGENGVVAGAGGRGGDGGRTKFEPSDPRYVGPSGIAGEAGVGGVVGISGTLRLANSILFDNTGGGNLGGILEDLGHNLSSDFSVSLSGPGSRVNVDPKLGVLGEYGGPSPVFPLLRGSAAMDGAGIESCAASDQHGHPRPLGSGCDIGAFESAVLDPPRVSFRVSSPAFTVGQTGHVDLEIINPNTGFTLTELVASLDLPPGVQAKSGPLEVRIPALSPGENSRTRIDVEWSGPGDHPVSVFVASSLTGERRVTTGAFVRVQASPEILATTARWGADQGAIVESLVIANGAWTSSWFHYGATESLGSRTEPTLVAKGFEPVRTRCDLPVDAPRGGLYYRCQASNELGVVEGPVQWLPPLQSLTIQDESGLRRAVEAGGYLRLAGQKYLRLSAPLIVSRTTVLDAGEGALTLSGEGKHRVFEVLSGVELTLLNVEVWHGWDARRGGGLLNSNGIVRMFGGAFVSNHVIGTAGDFERSGGDAEGGAIYSWGRLWMDGTRFEANSARGGDGASSPAAGGARPTSGGLAAGGALCQASNVAVLARGSWIRNQVYGGRGGHAKSQIGDGSRGSGGDGRSGRGGAVDLGAGRQFVVASTFTENAALGGAAGVRAYVMMGGGQTNGVAGSATGGAIHAEAGLVATRSLFVNNQARGGEGVPRGLEGEGSLAFVRPGQPGGDALGGALFSAQAVRLADCTLATNAVVPGTSGRGTVSDPSPEILGAARGGGLFSDGVSAQIFHCTFHFNGGDEGEDLATTSGTFRLANDIFGGDSRRPHLHGFFLDLGSNLFAEPALVVQSLSSRAGADARLLPLADNGGPTWTMALDTSSPAIDAGSDGFASAFDQRGLPRVSGVASDSGAFEVQAVPIVPSATAWLRSDGAVVLRFVAWPNRRVVIETTSDFRQWRGSSTNVTGTDGVLEAVDADQVLPAY
ncbi:MAG: hypothetical protein L6Q38_07350, partial [Nitrospira sp.]|nr:hypothetical protein [Nitrospira sp.]